MVSPLEEEFKQIKDQIYHSKYRNALELIDKLLKKKGLLKEDKLHLLNSKSEILNYKGQFVEAVRIAEEVLMESKELDNPLIYVEALIKIAFSKLFNYIYDDGEALCKDGLTIIEENKDNSSFDLRKSKGYLLEGLALASFNKGELKQALGYLTEYIQLAKKYNDPMQVLRAENSEIYLYFYQGQLDKALSLGKQALKKSTEADNKYMISHNHMIIAQIYKSRREIEKAIESLKKALKAAADIDSVWLHKLAYPFLGEMYLNTMKLDEAIELLEKSLVSGLTSFGGYAYLGLCYFWKNDFKKSEENYKKALEDSLKVGEKRSLPFVYSNLVELSIEVSNNHQAQKYLEELQRISDETEDQGIKNLYQFTSGLFLKASSNMDDWFKAIDNFMKLLKNPEISDELMVKSLFHLLSIRLNELQETANPKVIEEVYKQISYLQAEAESKKYFMLQIEIYRLKSQLALLDLDLKKASILLVTAFKLAKNYGLNIVAQRVKNDQNRLAKQEEMWKQFKEKKAPLSETLREIPIAKSAREMAQETLMEVRDKQSGEIIEYRKLFALKI